MFQLVLVSWMLTLSSCLIWQIISFSLPLNQLRPSIYRRCRFWQNNFFFLFLFFHMQQIKQTAALHQNVRNNTLFPMHYIQWKIFFAYEIQSNSKLFIGGEQENHHASHSIKQFHTNWSESRTKKMEKKFKTFVSKFSSSLVTYVLGEQK